jgi:hypothetical protein
MDLCLESGVRFPTQVVGEEISLFLVLLDGTRCICNIVKAMVKSSQVTHYQACLTNMTRTLESVMRSWLTYKNPL